MPKKKPTKMMNIGKIAIFLSLFMYLMVPMAPLWAQGGDGTFQIEICSGDGWKIVTLDENGNEMPTPPSAQGHKKCSVCLVGAAHVSDGGFSFENARGINVTYVARATSQNFKTFFLNPNAQSHAPPVFS